MYLHFFYKIILKHIIFFHCIIIKHCTLLLPEPSSIRLFPYLSVYLFVSF
jgi:hypothetical protein